MALVPEYLYPNYPGALITKNGDTISIGMTDNNNIYFGSVKSDAGFSDEPYDLTLLEFDNGYKFVITAYRDIYGVAINGHWTYNGQDVATPPGTARYSTYVSAPSPRQVDVTRWWFSILTWFPADPYENLTPASDISLTIWMDTREPKHVDGEQVTLYSNLPNIIGDGVNTSFHAMDTVYAGGHEFNLPPYRFTLLNFTDLDAFNTFMKTAGDGQDRDTYDPEPPVPDRPPAGSDDPSGPGGGEGNYDDTSDPIDFPPLPTGGAIECGAVVAHRVSKQTIQAIIEKLWDDSIFSITTMWQRSIQDPMNAIVSLHCLPLTPEVDGSTPIYIGNFDTELSAPEISSQYVEVDCGTLRIKEYWGSALDYSPYTKIEIFLPFIGVKELRTEDAMNSLLHVKYYIDVLTGDCVAFIKCGLSVLYHFKGNCRMSVPLSSISSDIVSKLLGTAGGLVMGAGLAVGGGFTIPATLLGTSVGLSSASNVASTKVPVSRSSGLDGNAGLMDDFTPYVIIHRPVQSLARDYNKFKGYPSNITSILGNLSGYTEVEHVHLENIPNATSAEMEEIKNLLKQGVII